MLITVVAARILLLILSADFGHTTAVLNNDSTVTCNVSIDGVWLEKTVGETWQLPEEPCITHTCEFALVPDGESVSNSNNNNGTTAAMIAVDKVSREYCFMSCNNEYELITAPGKCCGTCVQTKCRPTSDDDHHNNNGTTTTVYAVGEMWKDADGCTFHECIRSPSNSQAIEISTYRKTCPPLERRCPRSRIQIRDCCPVCGIAEQSQSRPESGSSSGSAITATRNTPPAAAANHSFVFDAEYHASLMDPATYRNHPCARECRAGDAAAPLVCDYTFIVEWYETLSKACFDCPRTAADCQRPHCIAADGMARSIVVINRQMPGPRLQVCLGDTIRVDVVNRLMGESTTLHWHGLHQRDTPFMDGVPMVSQCPIAPHTTFRYTFRADHEGTHWWHSHTGVQRSDGALGALIVRRPHAELPAAVRDLYEFDEPEHTIIVQDWEHVSSQAAFNAFHHSLGDNKPKNILINGRGRYGEPTLLPKKTVTTATATTATTISEKGGASTTSGVELLPNDVDWVHAAAHESERLAEEQPSSSTNRNADGEGLTSTSNITDEELLSTLNETLSSAQQQPSVIVSSTPRRRRKRQTVQMMGTTGAGGFAPLAVFRVAANGTYRFRHINTGFLNCPVELSIDGHNLAVIASDGWYVEPVEVATLVSYAGERFDFVVHANRPVGNYWLRVRGLMDCDERFTKAHQVAVLRYAGAAETPGWPTTDDEEEEWPTYEYRRTGLQMNALNRGTGLVDSVSIAELTALHAIDERLLRPQADFQFYVYYDFYDKDNPHFNHPDLYSNAAMATTSTQFVGPQLNRITMRMPSSPLMVARDRLDATKFCNESSLAARGIDCSTEFCECSHVLQVPLNATVELVLVDEGYKYDANHPFHLHGHGFQVVAMERLRPSGISIEEIQRLDAAGNITRRLHGSPTKDTITVPDGGYTIVRFVADNPGYWLFHCHIEFHAEVGMSLVFKVGEHAQMRPVPRDYPQCASYKPRLGDTDSGATGSKTRTAGWLLGGAIVVVSSSLQHALLRF